MFHLALYEHKAIQAEGHVLQTFPRQQNARQSQIIFVSQMLNVLPRKNVAKNIVTLFALLPFHHRPPHHNRLDLQETRERKDSRENLVMLETMEQMAQEAGRDLPVQMEMLVTQV